MPTIQPYECHHILETINVDGLLDELAWEKAPTLDFYIPVTHSTPQSLSYGKLLWDEKYLYVGIKAYDKDIWGFHTERDSPTCNEDVLEVFLKPRKDSGAYYNFEINPLGTVYDAFNVKRGVRTTAWVVWFHNTHLATTYPQLATQNAWGDRYRHALCPAQPAVMEYMRALVKNLASYPLDTVEFEAFEFTPFRHFSFLEIERRTSCVRCDPRVRVLLGDWVKQLGGLFPSPFMHIGFVEPYELEKAAQRAGGVAQGELYIQHLTQVARLVEQASKHVVIWGDMNVLNSNTEIMAAIPPGITAVPWHNGLEKDYGAYLAPLAAKGISEYASTSVYGYYQIFPDFNQTFAALDNLLRDARKYGAIGLLLTLWTDDAQNLTRMSFPGVAYGMAGARQPGACASASRGLSSGAAPGGGRPGTPAARP